MKKIPKATCNKMGVKKKKKNWILSFNAWLHLWPSILAGVIVVFVCLTGTIIVYCDEILEWSAGDARYVNAEDKRASYDKLLQAISKEDSNLELSEMVFFNDPERSIRVRAFHNETNELAYLYLNPYSGNLIKVDYNAHFFYVMAHLHSDLLAGKIGGWVVLISTIIFFISCLTGLVLWWPKRWTKRTVKDSFTVKWKARFKRLNYDLHNVYGFYSLLLCFVLSLTGIIIFFNTLGDLLIESLGGTTEHMEDAMAKVEPDQESLDLVEFAYRALDRNSDAKNAGIWVYDLGDTGVFIFRMGVMGLKSVESLEFEVYNRYSGNLVSASKPHLTHEKVENTIWQLHMGQWWGQFGKLSTFIAGLVATSLPITGFLIWLGRRKKKKKIKTVSTS